MPSVRPQREEQDEVERIAGTVCLTDDLQVVRSVFSTSAQHEVVQCRLFSNQHGDLSKSLGGVIPPLVLTSWTCRRADDQMPLLDVLGQNLTGHEEVVHPRVLLTEHPLQVTKQIQQMELDGARRRGRQSHVA